LFEVESGFRENEELKAEIERLQGQVKSLNEWLADKNTIIASLRKEIAGQKEVLRMIGDFYSYI
jgi:hypothetical protein